MLVNTSKMRGEDAIRVHCNSRVDIVDRVGNLPGYGTAWYELTGISEDPHQQVQANGGF